MDEGVAGARNVGEHLYVSTEGSACSASNAGKMMIDAMADRSDAQVVALGYPETYVGYHLSIAAFRESIANTTNINFNDLPMQLRGTANHQATQIV